MSRPSLGFCGCSASIHKSALPVGLGPAYRLLWHVLLTNGQPSYTSSTDCSSFAQLLLHVRNLALSACLRMTHYWLHCGGWMAV